MPFDPSWPPTNAELESAPFRNQFNALKALIDALTAQVATLTGQLGTMADQLLPVGCIVGRAPDLAALPALPGTWLECNGQTVSDGTSPLDNVVLPDLNGANLFLRGASASGGTGGAPTHHHSMSGAYNATAGGDINGVLTTGDTDEVGNVPPYYEVVWLIRVK